MKFIQIDSDGYFKFGEIRINDESFGHSLLQNIKREEKGEFTTTFNDEKYLVEAFDEPLVAKQVIKNSNGSWEILAPYGYQVGFFLESLVTDDWDRFHGVTHTGIPFVFSREAQAEFFRLVDELTDEAIIVNGKTIPIPYWYQLNPEVNKSEFWTHIYQTETPGWDMKGPTPVLVGILPKLKLTRQRVLVLGCGEGHDAAYFARQGHIVTAIDFSPEAIGRAQKHYGDLADLKFLCQDVFSLPEDWSSRFDLVFEHTCYCAINPDRRNDLIKVWKRLLVSGGHLLGVFFAVSKLMGPPFGGTEYEIYHRLKKHFNFLLWQRCKDSHPQRMGRELLVLAQKI